MAKKFGVTVVKKVINEKTFLAVKLGKAITSKEIKLLRVYLADCLKTFSFEQDDVSEV